MSTNISQDTINKNIQNAKNYMKESDVKDCNQGLRNADINGDGQTTGIEMYKKWSDTCVSVFAGNEEFLKRGEEISIAQGELYARYAGKDGVLDAYEYNAALQSDEMGALIDEYYEMKDVMDASKNNPNTALSRQDSDNDGKVTVSEFLENKLNLFKDIFKDKEPALQKEALDSVLNQAEIISKYAGDDGVLSEEEYIQALRSESYGASMEQYTQIKEQLKSFME